MLYHLFILCPPYSGSTVLWKLLSTSSNVSALPSEGQFLPELVDTMRDGAWDRTRTLPWPEIKAVWERYWDHSKPVLLEKSPPNIIRTADIVANFQPVKFVIMVRNPYAQAEGLVRRNNWPLKRAGNFAMMCLRTQLENAQSLDNALVMTYESLVSDPGRACRELSDFMPALNDMDPRASFEVHSVDGTLNRPITDLNAKKIASLSSDELGTLNEIFLQNAETLSSWGYELLEAHENPQ